MNFNNFCSLGENCGQRPNFTHKIINHLKSKLSYRYTMKMGWVRIGHEGKIKG